MESQIKKSPHPLAWAAGIAVIVFCTAGIAAIMGWIPNSSSQTGSTEAAVAPEKATAAVAAPAAKPHKAYVRSENTEPAQSRCYDCGVI